MDYYTTAEWNEALWLKAEQVYHQSFPEKGRKNRAIIRGMFEKGMCSLHTAAERSEVIAMALSAVNHEDKVLVIDYLAVGEEFRGMGTGRLFMDYIKTWAETAARCKGIVIEVEADPSSDNIRRIRFWEQCGFQLTDYVHHYIWVPEPYTAMYMSLHPDWPVTDDGEILFRYITRFHAKAYRGHTRA